MSEADPFRAAPREVVRQFDEWFQREQSEGGPAVPFNSSGLFVAWSAGWRAAENRIGFKEKPSP